MKRTQPAVSIIVPIYNTERYLRRCLDSIVTQTLSDIEIILLNDGSKDGSLAIMKEYAKKDGRVQIMDKPNEGYGKTMNRGIDAASGKYVGIVESDDWIEADMYETLYKIARDNDVEVVKSRYVFFDDKTGASKPTKDTFSACDVEQVINPRRCPGVFYVSPSIWSAIYRRDFLNENEIRFLESPGASYQDTGFNFKVWAMADRVWLTQKPLLHYRVGHSCRSTASRDKAFCVCDEFREIERYMKDKPAKFQEVEKIFNAVKYGVWKWNLGRLEGGNREAFYKTFEEEFAPVFKDKKIDLANITSKDRLKLKMWANPKSAWLKIAWLLLNISRAFIKDRKGNGCTEYRILFDLIPIYRKSQVHQK
jgi:glycosyltransferase involved in cell wall biosynthesis